MTTYLLNRIASYSLSKYFFLEIITTIPTAITTTPTSTPMTDNSVIKLFCVSGFVEHWPNKATEQGGSFSGVGVGAALLNTRNFSGAALKNAIRIYEAATTTLRIADNRDKVE